MAPSRILFYGLNAVRFLSVVSMILVFASSILVMVTNIKAVNSFQSLKTSGNATTSDESILNSDYIEGSTVPNQAAGVFWAVVSTLLIIFQTIVLILSEVGWPAKFFDRFFPVLGSNFGTGALGIFQALIGAQILSHHVDEFSLVAAFLLFSVGCLNMLLGLIFREGLKNKRSIVVYQNESRAVLPTVVSKPIFVNASPAFTTAAKNRAMDLADRERKAAGLRGFILQKPEESLPRYASPSPVPPPSTRSASPTPSSIPSMYFSPPPPPPQPETPPLRLQRFKSTRTSGSSFVSPAARRHEQQQQLHTLPTRGEDEDDDDDMYTDRSVTPPPTFRSSPTAI